MSLKERIFESAAKSLAGKMISFFVKVVEKYAPDKLLLFAMNILDKHIPTRVISFVIEGVDKLVPRKVRSSAITAADEYVPDTVANSRKICAILAGIGKYIPDRIIPSDVAERWENLRVKFHIPRLLSRRRL